MKGATQLSYFVPVPWYQSLDSFSRRSDHPALETVPAVLARLTALQVGETAPPEIYLSDYDTGHIPPWTLRERSQDGHALIFIDANAKPTPNGERVAIQVIVVSTRILASPLYLVGRPGCGPRGMLHDLLQQVRVANKRKEKPL